MPKFPEIKPNDECVNHRNKLPMKTAKPVPDADTVFRVWMDFEIEDITDRTFVPVTYGMTVAEFRQQLKTYKPYLAEISSDKWIIRHAVWQNGLTVTELKPEQGKTLGDYSITEECNLKVDAKGSVFQNFLDSWINDDPPTLYVQIKNYLKQGNSLMKFTLLPYRLNTHKAGNQKKPGRWGYPRLKSRCGLNLDGPEIIFNPNQETNPAMKFLQICDWMRTGPMGNYVPGTWVRLSQREGAGPVNVWIKARLTNAQLPADDPLAFVADIWFIGARLGNVFMVGDNQMQIDALQLRFDMDFFKRYMAIVNQAIDEYENNKPDRQTEFRIWPGKQDMVADCLIHDPPDFCSLWRFLKPVGTAGDTVWTHTNKTNTVAEWDVEDPGVRFAYQYEPKE